MAAIRTVVAELARRQHGVVTLDQLADVGVTKGFAHRRLRTGEWVRIAHRLVVVAGVPGGALQRCMAAVLSRPAAFISGRTAASLLGLSTTRVGQLPEITVPYSASGRSSIAKVRRSQHFSAIDTLLVRGVATASAAETVFRMAQYVDAVRLMRLVDTVLIRDPEAAEDLGEIYVRHQGERMRGIARLRPILLERLEGAFAPTESALEAVADDVLRDLALPAITRQAPLPWAPRAGRVDRMIEDWKVIIELDGRTWHARTSEFERDRERDNAALRHGYRTVRLTWRMLTERPDYCRSLLMSLGPAPE